MLPSRILVATDGSPAANAAVTFAAEMAKLASDPAKAAADINAWVKKNTAGKITDIVSPQDFSNTTLLALINTIHLKVRWTHFKEADTVPQPFTLADGSKVDVQMMQTHDLQTRGAAAADYNLVALTTSGPVTVWVIVPNGSQTPETVIAALQQTGLSATLKAATTRPADVSLPRLSIKYTAQDLTGGLEAAGMKRAFDPTSMRGGRWNIATVLIPASVYVTSWAVMRLAGTGASPPPFEPLRLVLLLGLFLTLGAGEVIAGWDLGVAQMKIGDSLLMMGSEFPPHALSPKNRGGTSTYLHLYLADADAAFDRAVKAGCTIRMPISDTFWGDRYGQLEDGFGNLWTVATHKEDVPPEEMRRRAIEAMR